MLKMDTSKCEYLLGSSRHLLQGSPLGGRRSQHPGGKRWAPGAGGSKALARTPGRNCSAMQTSLPTPLVPRQVPKAWASFLKLKMERVGYNGARTDFLRSITGFSQ